MTDILTQPTPSESEYEAAFNQMFAEMRDLNEQMRRDQADIDRLKFETDAYKVEAAGYKTEAERLKSEGDILTGEIRATLERLEEMVKRC